MTKHITRQRKAVEEVLMSTAGTHPTADTVYFRVKELMPSIAMGTVYRNLNQMCDEGVLRRIIIPDAPDRFDIDTGEHDHLVCVCCGSLTDVTSGIVYIPPENIPENVTLLETEILLKCICAGCTNK